MSKSSVQLIIDTPAIQQKVSNPQFGVFVASKWKRLIDPYTPERIGQLKGKVGSTVLIRPFEIEYTVPYARYI